MLAKDMFGREIKIGDTVKKYSIINDKNSSYKVAKVKFIGPTCEGGESLVWAGGGGGHHPEACKVVELEELI